MCVSIRQMATELKIVMKECVFLKVSCNKFLMWFGEIVEALIIRKFVKLH